MSLESKEAPETSQPTVYSRLTLLSHLPLVLQSIKEHRTQTTIAKELGISKQAVSKLIKRLIEHEYIRLENIGATSVYQGGKPPITGYKSCNSKQ
jgi:predicted transcriptional regulator